MVDPGYYYLFTKNKLTWNLSVSGGKDIYRNRRLFYLLQVIKRTVFKFGLKAAVWVYLFLFFLFFLERKSNGSYMYSNFSLTQFFPLILGALDLVRKLQSSQQYNLKNYFRTKQSASFLQTFVDSSTHPILWITSISVWAFFKAFQKCRAGWILKITLTWALCKLWPVLILETQQGVFHIPPTCTNREREWAKQGNKN